MKGIVFNVFSQLVEETFGLSTWDEVLQKTTLASRGIYTSGGTYDDKELLLLVEELAKITHKSVTFPPKTNSRDF